MKIAIGIVLLAATMFFNTLSILANDSILLGKWSVSQIVVAKNTDGKVENAVLDSASQVNSYLPCPQVWEFKDSQTVVLHFSDGQEEATEYKIESDTLKVGFLGLMHHFRIDVSNQNLMLTVIYKYGWNRANGQVARIEENRIITLKRKEK